MTYIGVTNDFHTGSHFSMCSPRVKIDLENEKGNKFVINHEANEVQQSIYETYIGACQRMPKLDGLILNGDMTEGWNPKGKSDGLWCSNQRGQVVEAANLIEKMPITEDTWIRITYSSGYHTGHNPSTDEMLSQELRARGYKDVSLKFDHALVVNDMRLHASHSIGVAMNKTTSLTKELTFAMENQKDYGDIDIVLRAHCHYASHVYRDHKWGFIVPGWKARDEFVGSKGLKFDPKIGALVLNIPKTGKDFSYDFMEYSLKYPLDWEVVAA